MIKLLIVCFTFSLGWALSSFLLDETFYYIVGFASGGLLISIVAFGIFYLRTSSYFGSKVTKQVQHPPIIWGAPAITHQPPPQTTILKPNRNIQIIDDVGDKAIIIGDEGEKW
jgi:hypothetical protein